MTAMIAECAENARQCKWYASKTKNAEELTAVRAWLNSVRARPTGVRSNLRERSRLSAIMNCLYGGSSVSIVSAVIGCVPLSKATMSQYCEADERQIGRGRSSSNATASCSRHYFIWQRRSTRQHAS